MIDTTIVGTQPCLRHCVERYAERDAEHTCIYAQRDTGREREREKGKRERERDPAQDMEI